jgi:uncharacterized RDD family membrane protein YckC
MDKKETLAHPNKRYIATILDGAIIFLFMSPIFFLETLFNETSDTSLLILFGYQVLIYVLFDVVIPTITKGQTIGRYTFGLRLVRHDFKEAKWTEFFFRASIFIVLGYLSNVLLLSDITTYIWFFIFVMSIVLLYVHPLRKTVHDYVGRTLVVEDSLWKKLD